jgi:hypothetical protein
MKQTSTNVSCGFSLSNQDSGLDWTRVLQLTLSQSLRKDTLGNALGRALGPAYVL